MIAFLLFAPHVSPENILRGLYLKSLHFIDLEVNFKIVWPMFDPQKNTIIFEGHKLAPLRIELGSKV